MIVDLISEEHIFLDAYMKREWNYGTDIRSKPIYDQDNHTRNIRNFIFIMVSKNNIHIY